MEKLKEIWAGLLLIVSLLWVLTHLILIKLRGSVVIKEDNKWVLKLEIVLTSLLVLFGIERLVKTLSKN